jgi:hypothetical protein
VYDESTSDRIALRKVCYNLHLAWVITYRRAALRGAVGLRVRELIGEICAQKDVIIVKGHIAKIMCISVSQCCRRCGLLSDTHHGHERAEVTRQISKISLAQLAAMIAAAPLMCDCVAALRWPGRATPVVT